MLIGFEELESLVTIMEEGSFRKASEKLHRAQSSISYAIKVLEKELDLEIFDRRTYKPKLTKAGEVVYKHAKNLINAKSELLDIAQLVNSGVETELNIIFSVIFPTHLLAPILSEFRAKYPNTKLGIRFGSFSEPIVALASNQADLIVSIDPRNNIDYEAVAWNTVQLIPVASMQHSCHQEKDLTQYTEIVVGSRSLLATELSTGVVESDHTWHVTDYSLKINLIKANLGWGYVPKTLIEKELKNSILIKVPSRNSQNMPLFLVRKKKDIHRPALDYFWNLLLKVPSTPD